jgi:hypothetical protein
MIGLMSFGVSFNSEHNPLKVDAAVTALHLDTRE